MIRAKMLNRKATIERVTVPELRDELGAAVVLWETYLENIPVMVQALSANERAMLGSTGVDVSHRLFMNPLSEALTERDRMEIDDEIYDIHYVDDVAGMGHHWEVATSKQIDGGG